MKHFFLLLVLSLFVIPSTIQGQNNKIEDAANKAFNDGKYTDAQNLYNTAADFSNDENDIAKFKLKAKLATKAALLQQEGEMAFQQGNFEYAKQRFEELCKINPNDKTAIETIKKCEIEEHLKMAMHLYEQKEYDRALQYFNKAGNNNSWTQSQKKAYEVCKYEKTKSEPKQQPKVNTQKRWNPMFSIAVEAAPFGTPQDGAILLGVRLLNYSSRINVSLGCRFGVRGMLQTDSVRYIDENTNNTIQLNASYSYWQASPYVNFKIRLNSELSSGGLFLGAKGFLNYNFGYSLNLTEAEISNNKELYSNKKKYKTKDVVSPITSTVAAELGYCNETFDFYIYYSYDIVPSFKDKTLNKLEKDLTSPHGQFFSRTTFKERYKSTGYVGLGLRIFI